MKTNRVVIEMNLLEARDHIEAMLAVIDKMGLCEASRMVFLLQKVEFLAHEAADEMKMTAVEVSWLQEKGYEY